MVRRRSSHSCGYFHTDQHIVVHCSQVQSSSHQSFFLGDSDLCEGIPICSHPRVVVMVMVVIVYQHVLPSTGNVHLWCTLYQHHHGFQLETYHPWCLSVKISCHCNA